MTGWCSVRKKGQVEKVVSAVSRGWEEYKRCYLHLERGEGAGDGEGVKGGEGGQRGVDWVGDHTQGGGFETRTEVSTRAQKWKKI